jgi:hypothetical protein
MRTVLRWIGNPFSGDSAAAVLALAVILVIALLRLI